MNPATGGYWHFGFHMQVDLAEMMTAGKEAAYLGNYWKMGSLGGGHRRGGQKRVPARRSGAGRDAGSFQHYAALLGDGETNRAAFRTKLTMPVLVLNGDKGIPQEQTLNGVAGSPRASPRIWFRTAATPSARTTRPGSPTD